MKLSLFVLCSVLSLFARADLRTVRLADFSQPVGSCTLGGEFPGAQAKLSFADRDAMPYARLTFDLTKGNYVGWELPCALPAGSSELVVRCRVGGIERNRLFFRVLDADGQYHMQSRGERTTKDGWEEIRYDLAKFQAHWGGANDGVVRFPLRRLTAGVEAKGVQKQGTCDVADVAVKTTAGREALPACRLTCGPARFGALFTPIETPAVRVSIFRAEAAADVRPTAVRCVVTDWLGAEVCRQERSVKAVEADRRVALTPRMLGNRFGAFQMRADLLAGTNVLASGKTWFARLTTETPPRPSRWVGSCTHGGHGWGHGDLRFVDLLAAAGIGTVRDEVGWQAVEREKGKYALPPKFDAYVTALKAHNISLNLILDYGNGKVYPDSPVDTTAFAAWCGWMAATLKGRVDVFEIWNEPHNFEFKKYYDAKFPDDKDAWLDAFTSFTRAAVAAVRAEQPQATVVVAAEDVWHYLTAMVTRGIAAKEDVIAFHPYCHAQPRPEREFFFNDGGKALRALAQAHGGASRFRITEAGWTTVAPKGEVRAAFVGHYPVSTYPSQAQHLVRMYLLARQLGVESAIQYDFRDDGPDRHYTENNFGLVHEDYTPKPSFAAVAFMTRLLDGLSPAADLSDDTHRYHLIRFNGLHGETVYAAWAVEGERTIPVPEALRGTFTQYDLQGNATMFRPRNGSMTLKEMPFYLRADIGRLF